MPHALPPCERPRARTRDAHAALLAFLLTCALTCALGCSQTDLLARSSSVACLDPVDCEADGVCAPRACAALDAPALACDPLGDTGAAVPALVEVGDGCSGDALGQRFRFALCSCTDFVSESPLVVRGDSVGINGTLRSSAEVAIDGSLQVQGALELLEDAPLTLAGTLVEGQNAACNCAPGNLLDVAAIVAARGTDEAVLAAGFEPAQLETVGSDATVLLECGRYRVARIAGSSDLRLQVRGHVVLMVEGDLTLDAGMQLTLDEGAALDLFVAGNVRVAGPWLLGGEAEAGRVRVYVGGTGTIDLGAESSIAGLLYAPRAELVTRAPLDVYGPLFVRRTAPGDALTIDTRAPVSEANQCAVP